MSKNDDNLDPKFKEYLKNIDEDSEFEKFLDKKENELSENTLKNYRNAVRKFCMCHRETFEDMVHKFREERNQKIKRVNDELSLLIPFTLENSLIEKYQNKFIRNLHKELKLANSTVNENVKSLKAVLGELGIETPTYKKLDVDESDWDLLTKDDLKYILNLCTLPYKSFMTFAISTGFRLSDCLSLTVGDFINATFEYHGVREIDEFLKKVEGKEIMGKWKLVPEKTQKVKIKHTTYNTPESSEFIIMALKERIRFMERKNEEEGTNLKLQKTDALFSSKRLDYKKAPLETSVDKYFQKKSDALREKRILELQNKLNEGIITQETYDEDIERIPKANPHKFRKYYMSVINRHVQNIRLIGAMEGRKKGLPTDNAYIKIFDEDIKKAYESALNELTITYDKFSNAELNAMKEQLEADFEEERKEYEERIKILENENSKLSSQIDGIQEQINNFEKNLLKNDMVAFERAVSNNDYVKEDGSLRKIVMEIFKKNYEIGEITDSMESIAEDLVTKAYLQKKDERLTKYQVLGYEYDGDFYSMFEELENMKDDFIISKELSNKFPPRWENAIDDAILDYCEKKLEKNERIRYYEDMEEVYKMFEEAIGLRDFDRQIRLMKYAKNQEGDENKSKTSLF